MKAERKGRVVKQIQGYRIRQAVDGSKITGRYVVCAGKYPLLEAKGYKTYDEALDILNKIVNGEIAKPKKIKKNKRY
jgi:hypothetical protein